MRALLLLLIPIVAPAATLLVAPVTPHDSVHARWVVTARGVEWQWPDKIFASGF